MTSVSLLTLSAFNALEGFLFLKKFRRIVQLLSTFILALRNRLLQHHWVSWRGTSLNSLLELFVDIFPGWIVNLGSCLFFFFQCGPLKKKKKVFIEFVTVLLLLFYILVFGCEAYGILVPWRGSNPHILYWKCRVLTTGFPWKSLVMLTFEHPRVPSTGPGTQWWCRKSQGNHLHYVWWHFCHPRGELFHSFF